MRTLRNIIKTGVWTIIIIYLLIITMVHLPFVQTKLGAQASKMIGDKLNTKVTIDKVSLGFLNRIVIDGLTIYDQKSKKMITASRMAAGIDYLQLLKQRRIYVSSAQLFGFNGNFYKRDRASAPNYQFVLDSLASKDGGKKQSIELAINSLVIRHGRFKYDRYDKPDRAAAFNTDHIEIKDVSAHLIVPYYTEDSLLMNLKKLSLKEKSGFNLQNMSFYLAVNKGRAEVKEFRLRLPETDIRIKRVAATYGYKDGKLYVPSLKYDGILEPSRLCLADIACFVPVLKDCGQVVRVTSEFTGQGDCISINKLGISSPDNGISLDASGKVSGLGKKMAWTAAVKHSHCKMQAVQEIAKSIVKGDFSLPEFVLNMESVGYEGVLAGRDGCVNADGNITSGIGNVRLKFDKEHSKISSKVQAGNLDLCKLFGDKRFGKTATTVSIKGETGSGGIRRLDVDGVFPLFEYNKYQYRNITLDGTYDGKAVSGEFRIDDPNGQIALNGSVSTRSPMQISNLTASVQGLDLSALRITDKWKGSKFNLETLSTSGTIAGKDNNFFNGSISVKGLSLVSDESSYRLESLDLSAGKNMISMQGDFGAAEIEGQYSLGTIVNSVTNVLHSKLPTLCKDYKKADNRFKLRADITKSDWLNALLNVPLEIGAPLKIRAEVDDKADHLDLQCSVDDFVYDGSTYRDALVNIGTYNDSLLVKGQIRKVFGNGTGLDVDLRASAIDDCLKTGLSWDNHLERPLAGRLNAETEFAKTGDGQPDFHIRVKPSQILVNDTVWNVKPADITYNSGNLAIEHFAIEHNRQHLRIDGMATKSPEDSITVDLQDMDVKYILDLVNFHSVEFEGYATGKAYIKSVFYTPDLYADLTVGDFKFEGGRMGDLHASVNWNKAEKQIDIDAHADDEGGAQTLIYGNVSPARNTIDLNIRAIGTNIGFLESFCGSFLDNVEAEANGEVKLHGTLDNINLTGMLRADGKIRVKPLNTTYTLSNDTIRFLPDDIVFSNDTIRDRNGNVGIVSGHLYHRHLTRLSYDLNIDTRHLLCYDTHSYDGETFYGTAYGSGDCRIKGGNGRIDIDINITPEKGSFIEYNAANPEAISDQQFITWRDMTPKGWYALADGGPATPGSGRAAFSAADIPSDMHINFLINMTPDATLRVLMDEANEDYIALNGTGSIRASYFNKGSFDMFGTYLIDHGVYKLTIQNIIKKVFNFQQGGTIVFGGDPYDAALNLRAIYTINGVPLSDLQIGRSFSGNNVRVDCLMNIGGTPQAPRVDFDLELPTVNSEAAQMVRTVINSEEEMNQQVVYLLGVGRFYMQKNNSAAEEDGQQNQTSLAMQSLLSGTISQQISSLLGNIVKNNNWTFGANISTGDEGFNNAEYEGLVSGRLFNNRLLLNGQFGYRDNANATTSFIGDFDVSYLLLPSGNMAIKVYNQTNDRYFTKSSLNTQGIGIIMKKDFNSLMELFGRRRKKK